MVMTEDGPVSMCEHNARRDEYVLRPAALSGPARAYFDPIRGVIRMGPPGRIPPPETSPGPAASDTRLLSND